MDWCIGLTLSKIRTEVRGAAHSPKMHDMPNTWRIQWTEVARGTGVSAVNILYTHAIRCRDFLARVRFVLDGSNRRRDAVQTLPLSPGLGNGAPEIDVHISARELSAKKNGGTSAAVLAS